VYLYYPVIGIIPQELLSVFPYSQFEFSVEITDEVIEDLAYIIFESILLLKKDTHISIIWCKEISWQQRLINKMTEILRNSKIRRPVKTVEIQCM